MYRYILILLIFSSNCYSQFYTGVAIDPNKAFGIIDNPRTKNDHQGLHFDVEVGIIKNRFGFYILYGNFKEANYQKLALGTDYFFINYERLEMAVGSSISNIWKKQENSSETTAYVGWLGRLTGIFWVSPQWGLVGHFQYQSRPDLAVNGILEGKIGIRYLAKR